MSDRDLQNAIREEWLRLFDTVTEPELPGYEPWSGRLVMLGKKKKWPSLGQLNARRWRK